tara:strand:+ start:592 stop:792 length:201 start_codon:yes stop_codon:yes gene_type:complete
MTNLVQELFSGYANGIITDRECGDMIDLVTNTYTVVVDDKVEMDWDSEWENEEYQYELEATQYDYI